MSKSLAERYPETLADRVVRHANREKQFCKYDHEFTEENTYRHRGRRYCRACFARRQKERRAK